MQHELTLPSEAIQAFVLCQEIQDRLDEEDQTWPLPRHPRRIALHMLRVSLERMRNSQRQYPLSVVQAAFQALCPQDDR